MYGAKQSGRKDELIARLKNYMDDIPPDLAPGSWYHFNKKETQAVLEKFCAENFILVPSG